MTQIDLLDYAARVVAETSREAWTEVQKTLPLRDLLMVAHVDDYCRATGYPNVTGRELADWLRREVLTVRPRLTGAFNAHWLEKSGARKSRHPKEKRCAPYRLALEREAIDRAIQTAKVVKISR